MAQTFEEHLAAVVLAYPTPPMVWYMLRVRLV